MKKILILLLTVFLLFACDFDTSKVERIPVSGEIILEQEYLDNFKEIIIAGPFDVVLEQDGGHGLQVETYESLMQWVEVEVIDDCLILYLLDTTETNKFNVSFDDPSLNRITRYAILSGSRLKWPENDKYLNVVISFKNLEKIQIIGESSIKTVETLNAEDFKLEVAGACHLDADLNVTVFDADIAGAGNLDLRGRARYFKVSCAGAGTIKAYDFVADSVDLEIAGVCNAQVYAVESIEAEVAGMGTIKYMGNPSNISYEKAGIGSLKQVESEETEETEI